MFSYFDATKPEVKNNQPLVYTVGAYVGTWSNWRKFRKEWNLELSKKGLTYFHQTDFEFARSCAIAGKPIPSKHAIYNGWKKEEFDYLSDRLHRTINRKSNDGEFRLKPFASSVFTEDFDKVLPNELKNNPKCKSYYIFNVWVIMCAIAYWARESEYKEPIHYIFAGGDGEGGNLKRLFDSLMKSDTDREFFQLNKGFTRWGYDTEWMKQQPSLQAADIATFEAHKIALKWLDFLKADNPSDLLRQGMVSLSKSGFAGEIYDEAKCINSFADIIRFEKERAKFGLK